MNTNQNKIKKSAKKIKSFAKHYYVCVENKITVIGVFHTSRSPKNWSDRLHL